MCLVWQWIFFVWMAWTVDKVVVFVETTDVFLTNIISSTGVHKIPNTCHLVGCWLAMELRDWLPIIPLGFEVAFHRIIYFHLKKVYWNIMIQYNFFPKYMFVNWNLSLFLFILMGILLIKFIRLGKAPLFYGICLIPALSFCRLLITINDFFFAFPQHVMWIWQVLLCFL